MSVEENTSARKLHQIVECDKASLGFRRMAEKQVSSREMYLPWSRTSLYDSRFVSGAPSRAAATPKPLMKASGNPASSIKRALRPSWQHGPCTNCDI